MGRILGVDYGDRRVGLALSDGMKILASPLQVVPASRGLPGFLKSLIAEKEVERIVLGWPVNMDGTEGPKARQVLRFKEAIESQCGVPVDLWDERLSTVQALGLLREAGASCKQRRGKVDSAAAQIILQSYLDRCRSADASPGTEAGTE